MRKPWLWLPPYFAHEVAPYALPLLSKIPSATSPNWQSLNWGNSFFRNPVGIAGGVDKTGKQLLAWQALGAGFLEVGTITPRPQTPNPGNIIDRSLKLKALWNKMGFPNAGMTALAQALEGERHLIKIPLFINVGKNRDTSNEKAAQDYIKCINHLNKYSDFFVINISSPNTKNLRSLFNEQELRNFLRTIRADTPSTNHLLLKLSPDLSDLEICTVLETAASENISGFIFTNTTTHRPLPSPFPTDGGVSGAPLCLRSREVLELAVKHLGSQRKNLLLVSTGGIMDQTEVQLRLQMGANLVQVYSALIFEGPFFFRSLAQQLKDAAS